MPAGLSAFLFISVKADTMREAKTNSTNSPAAPQFFKDLSFEWMEAWKHRDLSVLNELVAGYFCFISQRVRHLCLVVYRFTVMTRPNHPNIPEKYMVTDAWSLQRQGWKAISRQPIPR